MSGETTTVTPSRMSAGNWKQSDLPPPVGITTTVSRPSRMDSTTSPCPSRKQSKPKNFLSAESASSMCIA
jgi:hypothetical protein